MARYLGDQRVPDRRATPLCLCGGVLRSEYGGWFACGDCRRWFRWEHLRRLAHLRAEQRNWRRRHTSRYSS